MEETFLLHYLYHSGHILSINVIISVKFSIKLVAEGLLKQLFLFYAI